MRACGDLVQQDLLRFKPNLRVGIVMDSLFSHISILKEWRARGIVGTIGLRRAQVAALSCDLPKGMHRIYRLGNVLVSVFMDNALVANASTFFTVDESSPIGTLPPAVKPIYSTPFTSLIHEACIAHPSDGQLLAAALGVVSNSLTTDPMLLAITGESRESLTTRERLDDVISTQGHSGNEREVRADKL